MRLTVIQMTPGSDKEANLAQAERLAEAAIEADRPDLIALPEIWTCLGGTRDGKFAAAERLPKPGSNEPPGPAYALLQGIARRHRITVHGGSIGELPSEGADRLFNTTLVFGPDGAELARYRKIHLFDIDGRDGSAYRESATYGRGSEVVTFPAASPAGPVTAGCAICYDLRFPELFLALRRAGSDVIVLPAAFTRETGRDHWEPLIRARAIETQSWIAAPATFGPHLDAAGNTRFTYGRSMIVDPWGQIVAQVSDGAAWATARIDQDLTQRVRADMPVLSHRVLA